MIAEIAEVRLKIANDLVHYFLKNVDAIVNHLVDHLSRLTVVTMERLNRILRSVLVVAALVGFLGGCSVETGMCSFTRGLAGPSFIEPSFCKTLREEKIRNEEYSRNQQQKRKERERIENERKGIAEYGRIKLFTANKWVDLNGNGYAEYPQEFIGIKKVFREDGGLRVYLYDNSGRKAKRTLRIYNSRGKEVFNHDFGLRSIADFGNSNSAKWLTSKGGYGNYKAIWHTNNIFTGSNEFEILP